MKIYFAGCDGSEFGIPELREKVLPKRLTSYHYVSESNMKKFKKARKDEEVHLIMDSGAFSAWSTGAEICIDKYIEFLESHHKNIDVIVNLDVIPGGKNKKPSREEIESAAKEGWENYEKICQSKVPKEKVLHIFHSGEEFKWLEKMVNEMDYIGLSPSNKNTTEQNIKWLDKCMKYVCNKDGVPKVKFHGFAVTSHRLMTRYPWWSVDSSSWAIQAGLGMIYVPNWDKKNSKWDYTVCHNVSVSSVVKNKDSYFYYPEEKKRTIQRYLKEVHEIGLGSSIYKVCEKKKNSKKWRKVHPSTAKNLGYSLDEGTILMEKREDLGAQNCYKTRYCLNAHFINEFQKTVPKYPRNFKVKQTQKLFT